MRFSLPHSEDEFVSSAKTTSIPPLIDLPRLLNASEKFIAEKESQDNLKLLLVPGSSLGGARPKASVRDEDGHLAIAKFPRKDDTFNTIV